MVTASSIAFDSCMGLIFHLLMWIILSPEGPQATSIKTITANEDFHTTMSSHSRILIEATVERKILQEAYVQTE